MSSNSEYEIAEEFEKFEPNQKKIRNITQKVRFELIKDNSKITTKNKKQEIIQIRIEFYFEPRINSNSHRYIQNQTYKRFESSR